MGWFQEWWLARNPAVDEGARADPFVERRLSLLPASDALYDSSNVPHATRWSLDLPTGTATRDYLAQGLATTQASLRNAGPDCDSLYFYRLSLFHEDMHNEAAIYMANSLGFAVPDMRDPVLRAAGICLLPAQVHRFGWQGAGFAFDNELGGREVALSACAIDAAPVTNARYAAFVEAGGYAQARFWSPAGNAWRTAGGADMPRFWRRHGSLWQQRWFGHWRDLDPHASAANLNCFEAEAWCAWAGRRLPTEAEWECSAITVEGFAWGDVWEWTSDFFQPWPGFLPHPYRDYSAPWFGSRRVLRGASVATHATCATRVIVISSRPSATIFAPAFVHARSEGAQVHLLHCRKVRFMLPVLSVTHAWMILSIAIVFEVAGTTSMRLSDGFTRLTPSIMIFVFYAVSFTLNTMIIRTLGLSVVYAVWSGVGTVLTSLIGYLYFKEPVSALKIGSTALIIIGVLGLHSATRAH